MQIAVGFTIYVVLILDGMLYLIKFGLHRYYFILLLHRYSEVLFAKSKGLFDSLHRPFDQFCFSESLIFLI
jgi:hypothetical protein